MIYYIYQKEVVVMLITYIQGKDVILSKGSITVKDNNNKTCGVVRNLRKFKDIQANRKPTVIIANTIKGKGVSYMENDIL
jgi:hypothetical protein